MYEEFFGFTERPFSIAPDPHYLYMSRSHEEAMAHLSYGLSQSGGFIVLTGEVGTGKTTLCRSLLETLPGDTDVALILNATLDESELLQTVCDELKIRRTVKDSPKQLLDRINTRLLKSFAKGRNTVLIIDEAQLLGRSVLEQIRLLTNLETTKTKLLKIILIGQPELNDVLRRQDLRQLSQRITARYHLGALQKIDIEAYLNTRLSVAGGRQPIFTKQAMARIFRFSEGIPRRINVLADHCLLSAYGKGRRVVDAPMVAAAANEVFLPATPMVRSWRWLEELPVWAWGLVALCVLNVLMWWLFTGGAKENANLREYSRQESRVSIPSQVLDESATTASPAEMSPVDVQAASGGSVTVSVLPLDASANVPEQVLEDASPLAATPLGATPLGATPMGATPMGATPEVSQAEKTVRNLTELSTELLARSAVTSESMAYRLLAERWGFEFPAMVLEPFCQVLIQQGMECIGIDEWDDFERFNRAALVELVTDDQIHHAVLIEIQVNRVALQAGEDVLWVDKRLFQQQWTGRGVAFWRLSGFDEQVWHEGAEGPGLSAALERLNRALERLNITPVDLNSDTFNAQMAQRVYALQTRFGLDADSLLGVQTKLLINEVLPDASEPVLVSRVSLP